MQRASAPLRELVRQLTALHFSRFRFDKLNRANVRTPRTSAQWRDDRMDAIDQESERVLRWRAEKLVPRFGQALLIGALVWLEIRSWLAFDWLLLWSATALIDGALSRRALTRPQDQ